MPKRSKKASAKKHKFVCIDGEAIEGDYCLIGSNTGKHLYRRGGLNTLEVFEYLLALKKANPGSVFVGFGIGYDVNQILVDLPPHIKDCVFRSSDDVEWCGYKFSYIPGKRFRLNNFVWDDVFGFFQRSFIKTVELILKENVPEYVASGKSARGQFKYRDWMKIFAYNQAECVLLEKVMDTFDGWLRDAGIDLKKKYYGASCIANWILASHGFVNQYPQYSSVNIGIGLMDIFDKAYFGGRIEALKLGTFGKVYNADINSAYPDATRRLPPLQFDWVKSKKYVPGEFGIWLVRWDIPDCVIGPLPWRGAGGAIYYPSNGLGWYHSPEVAHLLDRYPGQCEVLEGWYHRGTAGASTVLSTVIPDMYTTRLEFKAKGQGAEYPIKLGLNALYGKLAQSVGKAQYRCLPYAGFITSYTRARLLQAIRGYEDSIVGFATDGIMSLEPLPLEPSKELGGWSLDTYNECTYLMPGVYRLNGEQSLKLGMRGFRNLDWPTVLYELDLFGYSMVVQNTFVGYKLAQVEAYAPYYLQFIETEKRMNPYNLDKRHYFFDDIKGWAINHCDSKPINVPWVQSASRGLDANIKAIYNLFE